MRYQPHPHKSDFSYSMNIQMIKDTKDVRKLLIDPGQRRCDYIKEGPQKCVPYQRIYISPPLTEGNRKVGKAWIWDILSGKAFSCRMNCLGCYARRDQRNPNVFNKRLINMHRYFHDRERLMQDIKAQLMTEKFDVVRLHAGGEYIDQEYVDWWKDIMRSFSEIRFYGYTKKPELDYSGVKNFNVVQSIIDGKINYGSMEYIQELADKYGAVICPAGIDDSQHCMDQCKKCLDHTYVVFLRH